MGGHFARVGCTIASPQTSFGVRSSHIHSSPTEKNECVTNEPQRTYAGRLGAPKPLCDCPGQVEI